MRTKFHILSIFFVLLQSAQAQDIAVCGITGSGSNAHVTQYAAGVTLTWDAGGSKYAFDMPENTGLPNSNYQSVKYGDGNTVYVPYKAIVNGQTDNLKAILTFANDSLKQKPIVFKTLSAGVEIPATKISDTEYDLQLQGAYDYAEDDVIAVMLDSTNSTQNQQVIGSFKLVHLSPKTINVTLVPTDETSRTKFKLEHVWNKHNTQQNATPLLMDYSNGTQLSHLDWKQINDPALRFYAFQGDEAGMSVDKNGFKVQEMLRILRYISTKKIPSEGCQSKNIQIRANMYSFIDIKLGSKTGKVELKDKEIQLSQVP
jgi:hypothetical protein